MTHRVTIAFIGVLAICQTYSHAAENRIWKTKSGATAEASFVKEANGTVTLKKPDASFVQIARVKLSSDDEAYLAKLLYTPKTVTVSFEPHTYQGQIVFLEKEEKNTLKSRTSKNWPRTGVARDVKAAEIQQTDTLCFRVMSEFTGEWADDSKWSVLIAEDAGKTLTGNAEWTQLKRDTDGRFVRVVFKLTNNSKDEKYINVPSLVDAKERRVQILDDSGRFIDGQYKDPDLDKLPPGFERTYCALYEIANDADGLTLMVPTLASHRISEGGASIPVGEKAVILDSTKGKSQP